MRYGAEAHTTARATGHTDHRTRLSSMRALLNAMKATKKRRIFAMGMMINDRGQDARNSTLDGKLLDVGPKR